MELNVFKDFKTNETVLHLRAEARISEDYGNDVGVRLRRFDVI